MVGAGKRIGGVRLAWAALSELPEARWLALLAGAVIVPRLVWIFAMPTVPFDDFAMYDTFAKRIVAGLGYVEKDGSPTAYWPVGYAVFLAGIYRAVGHHYFVVKLAQVALALGTSLCVYALAAPFSKPVARLAALLTALWPSLIGMVDILASENAFVPLFAASVLLFGWIVLGKPRAHPLLAGLALGLATLVRPVAAGVAVCALAFALLRRRASWRMVGRVAVAGAVAALVILPWSVRNWRLMGAFVPVSTSGGLNLWMGNHHAATGGWVEPTALRPITVHLSEVERDRFYRGMAWAFIRAHPLAMLRLAPLKLWHFAARDTVTVGWMHFDSLASPRPHWLKIAFAGLAQAYYVLALLLALYGLAGGALRKPEGWWIALVCAYYVGVHLALRGDPRYHLPVLPLLAVFAALGVARWAQAAAPAPLPQAEALPQDAPAAAPQAAAMDSR